MGCLLVPFKLIGFLLELLEDALVDGWCYLMRRILPEKEISQKARFVVEIIFDLFSGALLFATVVGIILMLFGDEYMKYLGKFMLFIPLGIGVVQIIAGILLRRISKKK